MQYKRVWYLLIALKYFNGIFQRIFEMAYFSPKIYGDISQ